MSDPWKSKMMSLMTDHKFLLSHLWRVLIWENNVCPIVIFIVLTIFFWIFAMVKASVVTSFALVGILFTTIDGVGPTLYPQLQAALGSERESDYEAACAFLALPFKLAEKAIDMMADLKRRQKVLLLFAIAAVFLVFSLLGRVNNVYLCYLVTLIYFLAPGTMKKCGLSMDSSTSSSSSSSFSGSTPFSPSPTRTGSSEMVSSSPFSSTPPRPSFGISSPPGGGSGLGSPSSNEGVSKVKSDDDDKD